MSMGVGHTGQNRGVTPVPVGRRFAISAPVDCWISIGSNASGDASEHDFHHAWILGGKVYVFLIPAASPPQFLSGVTTDPNGDLAPTQITFVDSGASGI
jgi:hypothetical protein